MGFRRPHESPSSHDKKEISIHQSSILFTSWQFAKKFEISNETNLSGGFRSVGFNYHYRQYVAENWQIFGEAVYERYSSDIQDSPIARNDYEAEVGIGFIYVF